jgi:hypothetical protein
VSDFGKCRGWVVRGVRGALLLGATLAAGCGAKTGLETPDPIEEPVPDDVPCVTVPFDGEPIEVPLEIRAELGRADVVFTIDTTASMQDEIEGIRSQLRDRIAPAVEAEIPDAQFAVATFADFPIDPFGDPGDDPFTLLLPMTSVLADVQAAVNAIELGNGRDEAESQVEALYQLATGEGLAGFVPASFGCPGGGFGYPCFRTDALPIVLLFTDAPMHNGPSGRSPYSGVIVPAPHTYAEAAEALTALGVRVLGFDSGDGEGAGDLRQLGRDTSSVDAMGNPLVFDIGRRGERLGTGVVEAMRTFASSVIFDIDAVAVDPDATDGVDATEFVETIAPLRADPMENVERIDFERGVFVGTRAGTTIVFQVRVRNDAVVPGPTARRFRLEVVFRGDGRTRIGAAQLEIVIPGADGEGCDPNMAGSG